MTDFRAETDAAKAALYAAEDTLLFPVTLPPQLPVPPAQANPSVLINALANAQSGDVIQLPTGTYTVSPPQVTEVPAGVTLMPAPGAKVALVASLNLGAGATLQGIELYQTPAWASLNKPGVIITVPGCSVLNCNLHECYGGMNLEWMGFQWGLIEGNLIWGNRNGHGIYSHNYPGASVGKIAAIKHNVFWGNAEAYGLHLYSPTNYIQDYLIDGNLFLDGLTLGATNAPSRNITYQNNISEGGVARFGYPIPNLDLHLLNNIFHLHSAFLVAHWQTLQDSGNVYADQVISWTSTQALSSLNGLLPGSRTIPLNGTDGRMAYLIIFSRYGTIQPGATVVLDLSQVNMVVGHKYHAYDIRTGIPVGFNMTWKTPAPTYQLSITGTTQFLVLKDVT